MNTGINRIRLEFKGSSAISIRRCTCVLIESDWNLKVVEPPPAFVGIMVLIESDWNLKSAMIPSHSLTGDRINRIRLEFKDHLLMTSS